MTKEERSVIAAVGSVRSVLAEGRDVRAPGQAVCEWDLVEALRYLFLAVARMRTAPDDRPLMNDVPGWVTGTVAAVVAASLPPRDSATSSTGYEILIYEAAGDVLLAIDDHLGALELYERGLSGLALVEDRQLEGLDMESDTAIGYVGAVFAMIERIWGRARKSHWKGARAPRSNVERYLRFRRTLAGRYAQRGPA